jgi:serine/threonine protein phosphatase PrpC
MMSHMKTAALSDIGCKRTNNEDSFGYDESLNVYVVSDGMGGSAAGEIASYLCVTETLACYGRLQAANPSMAAYDLLYHSVRQAHEAVSRRASEEPALRGMGATLVAVCFAGRSAVVANVGDSRAYLFRGGIGTQITQDHSLAEEQVRLGLMTSEEAANSPIATTITRAMGVGAQLEPDLFAAEMVPGDRLLLATDGLMRHLSDAEIASLVTEARDPEQGCASLIHLTRERGAGDNVTCLLVEIL